MVSQATCSYGLAGAHLLVNYRNYPQIDSGCSLLNFILVDEKVASFHEYLRNWYKIGTIIFSIPGAII